VGAEYEEADFNGNAKLEGARLGVEKQSLVSRSSGRHRITGTKLSRE